MYIKITSWSFFLWFCWLLKKGFELAELDFILLFKEAIAVLLVLIELVKFIRKAQACVRTMLHSALFNKTLSAIDHMPPVSFVNNFCLANPTSIKIDISAKLIERIWVSLCNMRGMSHDEPSKLFFSSFKQRTALTISILVLWLGQVSMDVFKSCKRETWEDFVMKLPMNDKDKPPRPILNVFMI